MTIMRSKDVQAYFGGASAPLRGKDGAPSCAMSEAQLHRSVAAFLRRALKPPATWTTIAHGGGGRVRGAQLKAAGLVPGWPDILIIDRGPNVIGIELKAKKGIQQPAQRMIAQAFKDVQAWYILCRSVEEVEKALRFCKVELHATVIPGGRTMNCITQAEGCSAHER